MIEEERYSKILKIRTFEETVLDLFRQNKLSGTTHTYIGEEATAVAIMEYITDNDFIFSNHRCHGHYLAYGGDEKSLLAEIMSKESGLCQGRGGSQHIHYKNFFTNGIQGGIVPNAVGVGMANKVAKKDGNVVVFLGDGTLGQGVVYESLNIAAVYEVPVMFVIEDNQYAMSTKRTDVIAGDIKTRIEGFGIQSFEITSTDIDVLHDFFANVFEYINRERKPVCAIVHNYRLGAHSKGDDTRNPIEIEAHKKYDPVCIVAERLGEDRVNEIKLEYSQNLERIVQELALEESIKVKNFDNNLQPVEMSFLPVEEKRYVEIMRDAFEKELSRNENIVFMGEDICDPYGGAFKATKGLSTKFGSRVLNMPISEAAMVGIGVGMALNHSIPVVEMMFGDFVTLAFDQLINHAAKYAWVYGGGVSVPMVLRVPMGAKRGYGPTHSQSLEKFIFGIPLIKLIALSPLHDPEKVYNFLFSSINEPTVVVENKKLYGEKTQNCTNLQYRDFSIREVNHCGYATLHLSMDFDESPDVYIITYGGMTGEVLEAATDLMIQDEIQADVILLCQVAPIPLMDLKQIMRQSVPVVFVEEGTKTGGIGAEYIATLVENGIGTSYSRVAANDLPIPNGIVLESQMIPDGQSIMNAVREAIK